MKIKTKAKIKAIVVSYIKLFPKEFSDIKKFLIEKRELLENEFGQMKTEMLKRILYEIPENLDTMFNEQLSIDELEEFKTLEGGRWFAKNFPDFRITKKI